MKDRKSLYLLIFALTVVSIAFILISIWGYHFYFAKKDTPPLVQNVQPENPMIHKTSLNDSLQTLLKATVEQMSNENDSIYYDSSVDKTLALKLIEFNKLKNEITEILKNKSSSQDMSVASQKITELQQSIDELKNKNDVIAEENARLNEMLKNVTNKKVIPSARTSRVTHSSKRNPALTASPLPLLVSHLRLAGVTLKDDNKVETNLADKTERLYGSFQINLKPQDMSSEIYVIVVQPNGKTLLNSAWESGNFETKRGRKIYSALLHFDIGKDNGKRLEFSIDSHNFQKGKYHMQIYHQGIMIGNLSKALD